MKPALLILSSLICISPLLYGQGEVVAFTGDAAQGKGVYKQHCKICHGKSGKGNGLGGFRMKSKPTNFTDGTYMGTRTDEQVFISIKEGSKAVRKSELMKPFKDKLTDDQIRDVTAYLKGFVK